MKVGQHLGGTCSFHLQVPKISHIRKQYEAGSMQSTAVAMKNYSFWGTTQCIQSKMYRSFGRTCRLEEQAKKEIMKKSGILQRHDPYGSYLYNSNRTKYHFFSYHQFCTAAQAVTISILSFGTKDAAGPGSSRFVL
jgi:hypothetical protein